MLINDKTIDWRKEWIVRFDSRHRPDDSAEWDERSVDYSKHAKGGEYSDEFIAGLDLSGGETIFDMGSGTGALALPLAEAGHRIICGDFSKGMCSRLMSKATEYGIADKIDMHLMAWEDDWAIAGIEPKSADIAVASRSIIVHDLGAAIEKLESVARKRVAITVATRFGPKELHEHGEMLNGLPFLPDYIYAINILMEMERYPLVSYIDSAKTEADGTSRLKRWAFIRWDLE